MIIIIKNDLKYFTIFFSLSFNRKKNKVIITILKNSIIFEQVIKIKSNN